MTTISEGVEAAPPPAAFPIVAQGDPLNFGSGATGLLRACTSFLGVLTLALVLIQFIFVLYRPTMDDPDIWWHMRNAEYLVQDHHFPRFDMYSFTVPGRPWINTEWLSEVPFYLAYKAFGLIGMQSLSFLLPTVLCLLLLNLCYRESSNFKSSIVACCFATFLAKVSYGPRTILFGYVFLLVLLTILRRFRDDGEAPLWVLPFLFCAWANTHGSWALGLVLFFLFGISGLFEGSWEHVETRRWTPKQLRDLIVSASCSVAALFVNPFGWRLVYYPFDLAFNQKLNIAHVQEWMPVNFQDLRGRLVFLLIAGLLLGGLFRSRRWHLDELLILLFSLYTALTHIRFLVLLGIVAAPILAKVLDFLPPYCPDMETRRVNVAVILTIVIGMVFFWPRNADLRRSLEKTYPAGAVEYIKAHGLQGNVLNFYLWGGYLDWHVRDMKVFLDSRVDIFEYAGVLRDYLNFLGADPWTRRPEGLLNKYHIQYVLFPPSDSTNQNLDGGGLMYILEHDPHWKVLYRDDVSVFLERSDHD